MYKIILYYYIIVYILFFITFAEKILNMRLEEILRERNLTKKAFCEMLHTLPQNLNASMKNPTTTTLERWSTALNIPIWQLFITKEELLKEEEQQESASFVCPRCGARLVVKEK